MKPVICWFRRDLRLDDNLALQAAIHSGQPVIPLFILQPSILNNERISLPRLKFMLSALASLDANLQKYGRRLLVLRGEPSDVLQSLITQTEATALYFNADYTPFARQRDEAITDALQIQVSVFHDRLLMPPGSVLTNDERPYTIFTPFKRKWRDAKSSRLSIADYPLNADVLHDLTGLDNTHVPTLEDLGFAASIQIPPATADHAHNLLDSWSADGLLHYAQKRDTLGNPHHSPSPLTGTSFLSPYIRFGLISTRTIYHACKDAYYDTQQAAAHESINTFVDEIIWQEFYTHILWHFPHVAQQNFNAKYDAVQWRHAPHDFAAWQAGMTGYPVVDAAMRQLTATGWMHNRARMITASFLTKDLLIHWREGERHFMHNLLDGDLAANNGGWQWAASTGTDAQPYFRIFNPTTQSKKFDPDGAFIRSWLPELRDVPDKFIHEPHKAPRPPGAYPAPIVDHSAARQATLAAFQVTKESSPSTQKEK